MGRLVDVLRPFVRAARALRDGALHPLRRARARKAVSTLPSIRSVLFLCTGNICRSPYAEKAFYRFLPEALPHGIDIGSAGFLAAGRPSPEEAVRAAERSSVGLGDHRSRTVHGTMLESADLVVVMERAHHRGVARMSHSTPRPVLMLGDLDPETPRQREIQDPWGHPPAVFYASFDRIDRCLAVLAELVRETQGNAHPSASPPAERDH